MFLARITANSEIETIIFLVGADLKAGDHLALAQTKRSIMLSDTNNTNTVTAFFKTQ
jgi:ABC-type glucose/galactose transport system permease subunit